MCKKLTYEFVKAEFEKEGYILLVDKYINCRQWLKYICPNGHRYHVQWYSWNSHNRRCPYCSGSFLHIDKVKQSFKKEGYILLIDNFPEGSGSNAMKKLLYKCCDGHIHSMSWDRWFAGFRCPTCKAIRQAIRMSGSGNYQWTGGCSDKGYCSIWRDKDYKNSIKERDGYKCLNPDCRSVSKMLDIHHINYVKKDCHPSNLITVCRSCNIRANADKEWHTSWYQTIMTNRYGYIYE